MSIRDSGYSGRVVRVIQETETAVTFEVALEHGFRLNFRSGQHALASFPLGNTWFRRVLSFSSSPDENYLAFTVKQVWHGRVSTYITERLRVGERVVIDSPQGEFTLPLDAPESQRYVFLAAGSGIVPIFSMIKELLGRNELADITLVYTNRSPENVLFKRALEVLDFRHESFKIHWHYTRKEGDVSDHSQRLSGDAVLELVGDAGPAHYYVSTQAALAKSFLDALAASGVSETHVHFELFSAASHVTDGVELQPRRITFEYSSLLGKEVTVQQKQVETLLETANAAGVAVPYNCTLGNCHACKLKVVHGSTVMDEPNTLSIQDAQAGYVLACVTYPCEDVVVQVPRKN
ncbi:phenylacetate-CoA oxygenase/reductase, PaaK subunit [gamma proteobacterium HdN1]|nr:phenylacetate-CoA oxygenase/reductase, PaaK subunit [gamma proteobacterium HdN1]